MKINIPKVVTEVDLGGYNDELKGQQLFCWVNPPLNVLEQYSLILTDLYEEAFLQKQAEDKKNAEQKIAPAEQFKQYLAEKRDTPVDRTEPEKLEWFVQVLSQGADPDTHWSLEELRQIEEQDPAFLAWMISAYWKARAEHQSRKKKS